MSNAKTIIQIKRLTTTQRTGYTPPAGELVVDTTTDRLYRGDGTTAGGLAIRSSASGVTETVLTTSAQNIGAEDIVRTADRAWLMTGAATGVTIANVDTTLTSANSIELTQQADDEFRRLVPGTAVSLTIGDLFYFSATANGNNSDTNEVGGLFRTVQNFTWTNAGDEAANINNNPVATRLSRSVFINEAGGFPTSVPTTFRTGEIYSSGGVRALFVGDRDRVVTDLAQLNIQNPFGDSSVQNLWLVLNKYGSGGDLTFNLNAGTQTTTADIKNGVVDIANLSATGTASSTTFLRGDNTWSPAGGGITRLVVGTATALAVGELFYYSAREGNVQATVNELGSIFRTEQAFTWTNPGDEAAIANGDVVANNIVRQPFTYQTDGFPTSAPHLFRTGEIYTSGGMRAMFIGDRDQTVPTTQALAVFNPFTSTAELQNVWLVFNRYGSGGDLTFTADEGTQETTAVLKDDTVGIAELSATGTPSNTTFLRGDNTWSTIASADDDVTYSDFDQPPTTYLVEAIGVGPGAVTANSFLPMPITGTNTDAVTFHGTLNNAGFQVSTTGSVTVHFSDIQITTIGTNGTSSVRAVIWNNDTDAVVASTTTTRVLVSNDTTTFDYGSLTTNLTTGVNYQLGFVFQTGTVNTVNADFQYTPVHRSIIAEGVNTAATLALSGDIVESKRYVITGGTTTGNAVTASLTEFIDQEFEISSLPSTTTAPAAADELAVLDVSTGNQQKMTKDTFFDGVNMSYQGSGSDHFQLHFPSRGAIRIVGPNAVSTVITETGVVGPVTISNNAWRDTTFSAGTETIVLGVGTFFSHDAQITLRAQIEDAPDVSGVPGAFQFQAESATSPVINSGATGTFNFGSIAVVKDAARPWRRLRWRLGQLSGADATYFTQPNITASLSDPAITGGDAKPLTIEGDVTAHEDYVFRVLTDTDDETTGTWVQVDQSHVAVTNVDVDGSILTHSTTGELGTQIPNASVSTVTDSNVPFATPTRVLDLVFASTIANDNTYSIAGLGINQTLGMNAWRFTSAAQTGNTSASFLATTGLAVGTSIEPSGSATYRQLTIHVRDNTSEGGAANDFFSQALGSNLTGFQGGLGLGYNDRTYASTSSQARIVLIRATDSNYVVLRIRRMQAFLAAGETNVDFTFDVLMGEGVKFVDGTQLYVASVAGSSTSIPVGSLTGVTVSQDVEWRSNYVPASSISTTFPSTPGFADEFFSITNMTWYKFSGVTTTESSGVPAGWNSLS